MLYIRQSDPDVALPGHLPLVSMIGDCFSIRCSSTLVSFSPAQNRCSILVISAPVRGGYSGASARAYIVSRLRTRRSPRTTAVAFERALLTRVFLVALASDISVTPVQFHQASFAIAPFAGDQRGTGPAEQIRNDVAGLAGRVTLRWRRTLDVYLVDGTYELFRHYYALPSTRSRRLRGRRRPRRTRVSARYDQGRRHAYRRRNRPCH
jgi:hypothetical protein